MGEINKNIERNLSVGHNATVGHNLIVRGGMNIGHDLKVGGRLEAQDVKVCSKGMFGTYDELLAAYPNGTAQPGWWALVGTASPWALYRSGPNGNWVSTSTVSASDLQLDMARHDADIDHLEEELDGVIATKADKAQVDQLQQSVDDLSATVENKADQEAVDEIAERIGDIESWDRILKFEGVAAEILHVADSGTSAISPQVLWHPGRKAFVCRSGSTLYSSWIGSELYVPAKGHLYIDTITGTAYIYEDGDLKIVGGEQIEAAIAKICVKTTQTDMADLILATEDGSPIATFDGGHVSTRNFDSRTAATQQDIEQAVAAVRHPVTAVPSSVADLVLATPDGTPIATFDGGHIRTRYFDSANIAAGGGSGHPVQVQHTDEAQLIVLDDGGEEVMRVQDGHIITENFNSAYSGSGGESGSEYGGMWLSVIGDSISSKYLDGVTPMINRFFYDATTGTGVNSIDQMWWKIVGDTMGMQLRKVAAIGGTTVTGNSQQTEYSDSCGCSTARVEAIKNEDGFAPDVVIVYMGFNDWNAGRTVGTLTSAAPAEGTVDTFAQAYLLMVMKVMRAYPKAKVCCCTVMGCHRPSDSTWPVVNSQGATVADFNAAIRQVCDMTGAVCIDVHSCGVNYHNMTPEYSPTTDGIHPNAKGQRKMAEKIIKTLKNN